MIVLQKDRKTVVVEQFKAPGPVQFQLRSLNQKKGGGIQIFKKTKEKIVAKELK